MSPTGNGSLDPGAHRLGDDLDSLVGRVESELVESRVVSQLDAPKHSAAAFRLQFADGRLIKGRRLRDKATAERVQYILETVQLPAFPKLLARHGRALLMEWVEGRPVENGECLAIRSIAGFQAALHSFPVPSACPFIPEDAIAAQRTRSERHIRQLTDAAAIDEADAATYRTLLEKYEPSSCQVGFIHGDLCAENAIVDTTGTIKVVDNEAMNIGSCDGDLAHALYRWPMKPTECENYLSAYAETRALDDFTGSFPFWALASRLGSAAHRIGARERVARTPIQSLTALVRGLERGSSPVQLILETSSLGDSRQ